MTTTLRSKTQRLLADFRNAKGGTSRQYRRRMQVYVLIIIACMIGMFGWLSYLIIACPSGYCG